MGKRAGASSRCSVLSFLTCPPTDKESREAAHDRTSFSAWFRHEKREAARSAASFQPNSAEHEVSDQRSLLSMLVGWRRMREGTIRTSRPASSSLSSSVALSSPTAFVVLMRKGIGA